MTPAHLNEVRLVALGLGEAPAPVEAEHLAGCPACVAAIEEDTRLWAQFRQLPQPQPPPSLAAAASSGYRRARGVRHRPQEVMAGSFVVAALVVGLCFWGWQLAPGALVSFTLALPRWPSALSLGLTWSRMFATALPVLALSAGLLLAAVAIMLRRLTAMTAK
jgi:predicted anti-sigma-YlaC factor YlaD